MVEKQELYCHNCTNFVQFDIDLELNGNHVIKCPECGHEHRRVVEDGKITDARWGSTNNMYTIASASASATATQVSTYDTYNSGTQTDVYMYSAWMNTITNA